MGVCISISLPPPSHWIRHLVQWLYTILYSVGGGILSSCDSEHQTAAAGSKLQGRARSCVLGSCHNLSGPLLLSRDARSRACVSHCPLMTCTERPSSSAHCPMCPLATRQTHQLLANLPPNNSILHLSILPTSLAIGVSYLYPVGLSLHPRTSAGHACDWPVPNWLWNEFMIV